MQHLYEASGWTKRNGISYWACGERYRTRSHWQTSWITNIKRHFSTLETTFFKWLGLRIYYPMNVCGYIYIYMSVYMFWTLNVSQIILYICIMYVNICTRLMIWISATRGRWLGSCTTTVYVSLYVNEFTFFTTRGC